MMGALQLASGLLAYCVTGDGGWYKVEAIVL